MATRKVLIITYYWPPSGGSGVQRWLKHAKYLPEFGWDPVISTVANGEYPVLDPSLERNVPADMTVLKSAIWEPYAVYKKFIGQAASERVKIGVIQEKRERDWRRELAVALRGNFFIPDARVFWIKPALRDLRAYLKENTVAAIISTGPPHSAHLIAAQLKRETGLPWIADFRDPWTGIDYFDQLHLLPWAKAKHHRLEREVLNAADRVTTVTWSWARDLEQLGGRDVNVILNGYDAADFPDSPVTLQPQFSFNHLGVLHRYQNPILLWEALRECVGESPELKTALRIRLVGRTDASVVESISAQGLAGHLDLVDYVDHDTAIRYACTSPILLALLIDKPESRGVIPGKLYEYLAAKRPIVAIGDPNGDAARIIHQTNAGTMIAFQDKATMKREIQRLFTDFQRGTLTSASVDISAYSRRESARQFAEILGTGIS